MLGLLRRARTERYERALSVLPVLWTRSAVCVYVRVSF